MSSTEQVRTWRAKNIDRQQEQSQRYYETNKKVIAEKAKAYRQRNKAKIDERVKAWATTHPDRVRWHKNRSTWRRNGVDPVEAERVLVAHNGRCDCCGTESPMEARWCVDHDHATGRVRGVLCSKCNTAIGKLGDTLEGVLRAVKYLQRNQGD